MAIEGDLYEAMASYPGPGLGRYVSILMVKASPDCIKVD